MRAKTIKEIEEAVQTNFTTDCIKERRNLEREHLYNREININELFTKILYTVLIFFVPVVLICLWLF